MSVDKIKKSSLWALLLVSLSSKTFAVYHDVGSMLNAFAPTAAVSAPELNALIIAINAIPTTQAQLDALQTLIPSADGSLIAASVGPMRQMQMVLFDRLIRVNPKASVSGVSSGDEQVEPEKNQNLPKAQGQNNVVVTEKTEGEIDIIPEEPKKEDKQVIVAQPIKECHCKQNNALAEPKIEDKQDNKNNNNNDKDKVDMTQPLETKKDNENNTTETEAVAVAVDAALDAKSCPEEIDKGVWIQFVGNNTGQDWRGWVPGYDADVLGILIGRDKLITPHSMLGFAVGYVHADVDSRGPSGSFLDIKRFQGTLYGAYSFNCLFFLNGALTVAKNDYDNNRKILVPPYGGVPFVRIAWGGFSAWETNAYLEAGINWVNGHFHAIPKLIFSYSHFDFEGYIESDAFGLDLDVKYHDMKFFPCGMGLKLEYQNEFEQAYVVPEIHAYVFHYFENDPQTATALFTAGGFEFLSQGVVPSSTSFEVGAGIAVHSDLNAGVIIQYDYAATDDYHRHQAFIKVRYEWA